MEGRRDGKGASGPGQGGGEREARSIPSLGALLLLRERRALSALDGAVERPLAERAFARLAKSVLDNVARVGPAAALTGPAVRGDLDVVAGHLEVLGVGGDEAGSAVQLYRALLLRTAAMLEQDGRLDGEKLGALRALAAAAD